MTSNHQVGPETAWVGLSQLYPDMRFGQLIEMVAVLAGEESPEKAFDIDDTKLFQTALCHLSTRWRQLGKETTILAGSLPPIRLDLIRLLPELQKRYLGWRFGQLVSNVAGWSGVSLYDAEDEQLLIAARQHLV